MEVPQSTALGNLYKTKIKWNKTRSLPPQPSDSLSLISQIFMEHPLCVQQHCRHWRDPLNKPDWKILLLVVPLEGKEVRWWISELNKQGNYTMSQVVNGALEKQNTGTEERNSCWMGRVWFLNHVFMEDLMERVTPNQGQKEELEERSRWRGGISRF